MQAAFMITSVAILEVSKVDLNQPYPWVAAGVVNNHSLSSYIWKLTLYKASTLFLHKKTLRGDTTVAVETAFFLAALAIQYFTSKAGAAAAFSGAIWAVILHLSTIVVATVGYRLSPFHPLWSFPGPLINKVTSFKLLWVVYNGKRHLYIHDLHKKYGKFVRTGVSCYQDIDFKSLIPIQRSQYSQHRLSRCD